MQTPLFHGTFIAFHRLYCSLLFLLGFTGFPVHKLAFLFFYYLLFGKSFHIGTSSLQHSMFHCCFVVQNSNSQNQPTTTSFVSEYLALPSRVGDYLVLPSFRTKSKSKMASHSNHCCVLFPMRMRPTSPLLRKKTQVGGGGGGGGRRFVFFKKTNTLKTKIRDTGDERERNQLVKKIDMLVGDFGRFFIPFLFFCW